jgi:phage terminase large subunit-like protein
MNSSIKLSPQRQNKLEILNLLSEKEKRIKENPLKYAKSHPKQDEFFKSTKPIRVLFWGNRVGKTEGCAQEVVRYVLGENPNRDVSLPIEVWCACPSFDMQKETTQKKLEKYLPTGSIKHTTYITSGAWGEVELTNGSKLNFKSYEQGRDKFQGAGKRLIWFDEEPPKDIWEECTVRAEAGIDLDIIMSMTPIKGMTWVYDELFTKTGREDLFISLASWDDNPWLTEKQKNQMQVNLSDEAIQVRRFGKFVQRVGLVCNWWDRDKNTMLYQETPNEWSYYEVLDGGFSDPAAWLFIGVDQDNNVHVVDGFREKGLSDGEIVARRNAKKGLYRLVGGWIDYSDERLGENLNKLGMTLTRVEKKAGDSEHWDETLAEKLAEYGKMERGTGKPRLFINKNLDWLIQEIENLTWLEIKRSVGGETQIVPKWDDHRRFGHHFDGIRALAYFLVMYNKPSVNLPVYDVKKWKW